MIGCEGAVGLFLPYRGAPAFARAVVQAPGRFLAVERVSLEAASQRAPAAHDSQLRYADCLLAQAMQVAACNAAHSIEQRTARRLVELMERTRRRSVEMTQEQLGAIFGVGRSYMNRLLAAWQADGLVEWRRRILLVADAQGLLARACRCGEVVRGQFEAVLPGVYPPPLRAGEPAV
jgi:CRP-like cAMP-binding protein